MIPPSIYPWQYSQWQSLIANKEQNRLAHALLLVGSQGLGRKQFALTWVQTLLCRGGGLACEQCHSCHLVKAQSHPDFMLVEPDQPGGIIKVDQVRDVIQFSNETALQGQHRVIVLYPANAMNIYAANALLKTLEEPAPSCTLILITDLSLRLPATIMSRCQKISFHKPSRSIALEWLDKQTNGQQEISTILLNLADDAPLKAKEFMDNGFFALRQAFYQSLTLLSRKQTDPLQVALEYQDQDAKMLLSLLMIWVQDLLRLKLTQGQAEIVNVDFKEAFIHIANVLTSPKIIAYQDHIKKIYSHLLSALNLNRQLMLEEIFIRWEKLC